MIIISGVVNSDGTIRAGIGFKVFKAAGGVYGVSFDRDFKEIPAVTTAVVNDANLSLLDQSQVSALGRGQVTILTGRGDGAREDRPFTFIAVGE